MCCYPNPREYYPMLGALNYRHRQVQKSHTHFCYSHHLNEHRQQKIQRFQLDYRQTKVFMCAVMVAAPIGNTIAIIIRFITT